MSNEMAVFSFDNMPEYLRNKKMTPELKQFLNAAMGGIYIGGFPRMSYKGKEWSIKIGDEQIDFDEKHIDCAIVGVNPNMSKVFYSKTYSPGSIEPPDCSSADGIVPDSNVEHPVAEKCLECPKNKWGSKILDDGTKVKACGDYKRIAIAIKVPGKGLQIAQLQIPPGSQKGWGVFMGPFYERGSDCRDVITRISFAKGEAQPKLVFTAQRWLTSQEKATITAKVKSETNLNMILGTNDIYDLSPENTDGDIEYTQQLEAPKHNGEDTQTMEESRKPRGRPRKEPEQSKIQDEAQIEGQPAKRGRGRPAKPITESRKAVDTGTDDYGVSDDELDALFG